MNNLRLLLRNTYAGPIAVGVIVARGLESVANVVSYDFVGPLFHAYYYQGQRGLWLWQGALESLGRNSLNPLATILIGLVALLLAFWLYRDSGTGGAEPVSMRLKE